MNSLRSWFAASLALAALGMLVWLWFGKTDRPVRAATGAPTVHAKSGAASTGSAASITAPGATLRAAGVAAQLPRQTVADGKVVLNDGGRERAFTISLDELVRRTPEGIDQTIALTPAADLSGLRQQWSGLQRQGGGDVFPVAYEDGVHHSLQTRRLVTPKIRVELKEGEDIPQGIAGAVEITRPDYAPGFAVVRMPDSFAALDALDSVRALGGVHRADVLLAHQQSRRSLPNDTLISSQWHLKNTGQSGGVAGTDIDVEPVWNYPGSGWRGAGIVVGVVDDGLETAHPDLAANVRTDIDHDWNDSTPDDPNPVAGDDNNHGTSCAGNVAAVGNNALGVCGSAPEAKVVSLRLIAAAESDQEESEAMAWRNDVIPIKSNSWGPNDDGVTLEGPGSLTKAALQTAVTSGRGGLGTIFLWAGGNGGDVGDNSNYDGYANSIYTIAVAAISNKRTQSYYSESGANIVIASPSSGDTAAGELEITTIDRSGTSGYNTASGAAGNYATDFGGTSSATPTAAGVVALMLQRNPNLGWRDVQEILIKTALKVNPTDTDWTTNSGGYHFNHKFGAGLIDANAAVTQAAAWTNLGAQTSAVSTQSGLSVAIPNNNAAGVTRTFNMSATNIRVEQVTVRVTISHTARGNLAITLTSPSGVASRLAEVHGDTGNDYADWTFMTVHDWGENSAGTWTLKIADLSNTGNTTGGTLGAAELKIFGSAGTPVNPPPVVQMTSPQDQSSYSVGVPITLAATASDLTLGGSAGVISKVEFLSGATVVGTVTTPPYTTTWIPPAAGNYTLSARATDSENAAGVSSSVAITVANLPPSIAAASLSPAPQGFSDQAISVAGITASDPEGATVTFSYQWQSSTDGVNFSDAAGQTGSSVAASAANAGKVWRCVITPSDGVNMGAAFTTGTTMILTRPAGSVAAGGAYSYTSDLVLRGTTASFTRAAIINEFSQGTGTSEWVEILTLQTGSFRKWKFDDSTSDASVVTFADNAVWDNIPAGTRIVIYNGSSRDSFLPADDTDASDGTLVIASNNSTYFSGAWPSLSNNGDALILKDAGGNTIHQISYGSNTTVTPNIGAVGSGKAAAFTGDTEAAAATAGGWRINSSTTAGSATVAGVTPGAGNTIANDAFATHLRAGFFNQPAQFRFGASSQTPAGLTISANGLLSGTVTAASGDYAIVIERYNGLGETASFSYTLTVAPGIPTFATWIAGYPVSDASPAADPDHDGRSNLFEYFLALDPSTPDGAAAISVEYSGADLLLHYRKAKAVTGVTEQVQWSEDLQNWSQAGITFDADQDHGAYLLRTARKPAGASSKLFLRLVVTQSP